MSFDPYKNRELAFLLKEGVATFNILKSGKGFASFHGVKVENETGETIRVLIVYDPADEE